MLLVEQHPYAYVQLDVTLAADDDDALMDVAVAFAVLKNDALTMDCLNVLVDNYDAMIVSMELTEHFAANVT